MGLSIGGLKTEGGVRLTYLGVWTLGLTHYLPSPALSGLLLASDQKMLTNFLVRQVRVFSPPLTVACSCEAGEL